MTGVFVLLHEALAVLSHLVRSASPILHRYGVSALLLVLLAESAGVVFAPGEAMIVAAGFLVAKGVVPLLPALVCATLGATVGGYLAYGLGRRFGHAALLRYGRYVGIRPSLVARGHAFFERFGPVVVFFGRFVVPLRQLQGYIAGASEMAWWPFAIWSAVGAVAWVLAWGGAAFFLSGLIPA